uniref:Putative secreted protein n=1 Tax=Anopheles darlingi TaxID=43151 RepID=A0A2M4DH48_ANODA
MRFCGVWLVWMPLLGEQLLQFGAQLHRASGRSVPAHRFAPLVHQKLGKVPLDRVNERAALALLQILPQWVRLLPVDVNLGEHVEAHVAALGELLDLCVRARFLATELIAREGQYP